MTRPIIDPEFAALIPPLSEEEQAGLEASLLAEGCRDALVTWQDILLDGYHRLPLCEKHDIPYQTTTVELPDRPAAKVWMCRNQLNRRNLSTYQKGLLGIVIHENTPKRTGNQYTTTADGAEAPEARDVAAKTAGSSHRTMDEVRYLEQHADEGTKERLRRGEAPVRKTYKDIRIKQGVQPKPRDAGALPELGTFAIALGSDLAKYLSPSYDPRVEKLDKVLEVAGELTVAARHDLYYSLAGVAERVKTAMDRLAASGPLQLEAGDD